MVEINEEAITMLKAIQSNVSQAYNYFLDDEEPNQRISDGLRLARIASIITEINAQLVDLERITGVKLAY